jgi:hypothetical protein
MTKSTGETSEEKVVTVSQTEAPVKKRRLKKPSIQESNESVKTGVDEGAN